MNTMDELRLEIKELQESVSTNYSFIDQLSNRIDVLENTVADQENVISDLENTVIDLT